MLDAETQKIIDDGKDAVKTLKDTVPSFRKSLPKYGKLEGAAVLDDFLTELQNYQAFYNGLQTFIQEKKKRYNVTIDFSPVAALVKYATSKGIHKVIHPSHIPKQSFEQDIKVALVQVYNLYMNALADLVRLYKEALKFGNDDWSVSYKLQLGEKVSQYMALFSSELPCMEGQTDDIVHVVSGFRTRRQGKPGLRTRMTRTASQFFSKKWQALQTRLTRRGRTVAPESFRFKTRGAFNDHIERMDDKYQVFNLLMQAFRLSLCEGEESCTATKRLSQYYTYDKFKEFLVYLDSQKLMDSDKTRPFKQEEYLREVIEQIYAEDDPNQLFNPESMPDDKICCDVNAHITAIKIMGGKRNTTRRRRHAKR